MAYVDTLGDIMRVTVAYTQPDSQIQECNINYVCTAAGGGDSRPALGANAALVFSTNWIPFCATSTSQYGYKVSLLNRRPGPIPATNIATIPGTGGTNLPMPTQARPILSLRTAMAGRAYRGRLFLPSPSSASISSAGFLSTACATAGAAIGASLSIPFSSGGTTWNPVIAHRHKGPPVTWTFDPINDYLMRTKIGTQRKSGNYGRVNTVPW